MKKLLTLTAMVAMLALVFAINFAFADDFNGKNGSLKLGADIAKGIYNMFTGTGKNDPLKIVEADVVENAQRQGHNLVFKDFVEKRSVNNKSEFRLNLGTDNNQDVIIVTAVTTGDEPKFLAYKAFSSIEAARKASTERLYNTFDNYTKALIGPLTIQTSAVTPDSQR